MEHLASIDDETDPYGRLLRRLTCALDEASSLARLSDEPPGEMEVRGLSAAELALIAAYLANDHDWLKGWHATAAQQYWSGVVPSEPVQPPFERHSILSAGQWWHSSASVLPEI
ncbi:hypothetical protein DNK06_05135 [Pseudomonas daroniae]|uniref:Uncharacterized protein n=1 Tax=Phytopseudomonas daroniae TaxID=2487519 RepID=A0A4Q9QRS7_9GAMM|nr:MULTISPECIES: hypothetical protein [Pseudomonas]TBU78382.1 hypothetical protein DNK10_01160 [Pseudomonas daroniae]TBU82942.1 hypothetical protein DNK06_05135 [Pseudomonas daroniae]TBU85859.1 hypothetical protein DNK31_00925 [Pseudomonas sp. FRB 228]TBU95021.1 hypothetical protein DNJ99_00925 [Pseudomonas daroniae]